MKLKYFLLASLCCYSLAEAASTWNNTTTDEANWSDVSNWTGGVPTTGSNVIFPPLSVGFTSITAFQDIMGLSIDSISFSSTTAEYSIQSPIMTTQSLTFGGSAPTVTLDSVNTKFHDFAVIEIILASNLTINDSSTSGGLIMDNAFFSGVGSLTYNGSAGGRLELNDASTYTGGTTLNSGNIYLDEDYAFGSPGGGLGLAIGASGSTLLTPLTNNSVPITIRNATTMVGMPVILQGNSCIFDAHSEVGSVGITIEGIISGTGTFTAANTTGGGMYTGALVTITGDVGPNTYSGGTIVNSGATLVCTSLNSLPTFVSSTNQSVTSNGILQLNFTGSKSIGAISGSGVISLGSGGALALTVDGGNFSGAIENGTGATGSLIHSGVSPGTTLTLTGGSSYSGGTTVNGGTLVVGNSSALGTGSLTLTAGTTLSNTGALTVSVGNDIAIPGTATINGSSTAFQFGGNVTGVGPVTFAGPNQIGFRGPGSLQIPSIVNSGTTLLGLTSTIPMNITNNGAVVFDTDPSPIPYANTISGSGTIGIFGTAVINVTGSFQGTTTVTSAAGLIGTTTSLPIDIVNNGAVTLNGTGTYSHAITGTGTTTIGGGGTITVSGSIASPIMINSGSALVGTTATLLNNITDNGTLTFNQSVDATFTPTITGSGNLVKTGGGVITFPDANGYLGTTTLTTGGITLDTSVSKLGVGAITIGSGTTLTASADGVSLSNLITLVGSQTIGVTGGGTMTLSGNFSGGAGLTKTGSGVLKLNGTTSSTPSIAVNGGGLAVIGGSLTSNVTVASGSTLSGTGTIIGNVVNNGNLAPGASIGTLTVVGDYDQADNSFFTNEINSTQSDRLVVQGNMTIGTNATFALDPLPGFSYAGGGTYSVISTAGFGTITGNHFANFTSTNPGVHGLLTYLGDEILLTFYQSSLFPEGIFPGNPGKVETALDSLFLSGNLAVGGILNSLLLLNPTQLYDAFDAMHPAMYTAMTLAQENNAVVIRDTLTQRLQGILDDTHCSRCIDSSNKRDMSVWATGFGDFLHQGSAFTYDSPQVGYNDRTGGFVAGMDYHLIDLLYLGFLGGYTHSSIKWDDSRGKGDINSAYAGVYLSAIKDLFYGNVSFTGGWSGFNANRNIIFTGVDETATNFHHGKQVISHIDTGLNLTFDRFTIRPFDSLDWIVQSEGSYTETGAGEYNLIVDSHSGNMLRNELGLNFASCGYVRQAKFTADAKLGWVRETRLHGKDLTSTFEGTNVPFTVIGYFPNRNLLAVGGTLTSVLLQEHVTCSAYQDGQFDHKYVSRQDILTMTLYYNGVFGTSYADNSFGVQLNYGF